MAYRKFDTGTWQDPWFEDLGPKAKLAFIYLWTNDTCNQAGLYKISKRRMEFELGFSINGVMESLQDKIFWDPERQIVWVKNFVKWQCQNQSFFTAALKIVSEMPKDLQAEFVRYNQKLIENYSVDVSQYGVTTNPPPTPHGVDTNPASEQNSTETETETEQKTPARKKNDPKTGNGYNTEFEKFWEAYPKKVGKGAAWTAWKKKNGRRPDIQILVEVIEKHKQTPDWNKEGGQYIPNPATWLNQHRWEDEISPKHDQGCPIPKPQKDFEDLFK
jgi:hypothetical protein